MELKDRVFGKGLISFDLFLVDAESKFVVHLFYQNKSDFLACTFSSTEVACKRKQAGQDVELAKGSLKIGVKKWYNFFIESMNEKIQIYQREDREKTQKPEKAEKVLGAPIDLKKAPKTGGIVFTGHGKEFGIDSFTIDLLDVNEYMEHEQFLNLNTAPDNSRSKEIVDDDDENLEEDSDKKTDEKKEEKEETKTARFKEKEAHLKTHKKELPIDYEECLVPFDLAKKKQYCGKHFNDDASFKDCTSNYC